tara:strand:+ start:1057 stop:2409 length:1353 start_codon:yes stop_codon:yes gene_type:complete
MQDVIYIAQDRMTTSRLALYGGYNRMPGLQRLAEHGTVFKQATAPAASTIMCHSCEWTGLYPWQLHGDTTVFSERQYETKIPAPPRTVFSRMQQLGYDTYVVLVTKPDKYAVGYMHIQELMSDSKVVLVKDVDQPGGAIGRIEQMQAVLKCVEMSRARGKKAFVWTKMHGMYQGLADGNDHNFLIEHAKYDGQPRVTPDDCWWSATDQAIAWMLDGQISPQLDGVTVWFGSDHGAFQSGEHSRAHYGYHLRQEIVHVPLICSDVINGIDIDQPFSMRRLAELIPAQEEHHNVGSFNEETIYAETLFPGQLPHRSGTKESMMKIMVREGRWKLIVCPYGEQGDGDPCALLYDLEYDPHEKANLSQGAADEPYIDYPRDHFGAAAVRDIAFRLRLDLDPVQCNVPLSKALKVYEAGWDQAAEIEQSLLVKALAIWSASGRQALVERAKQCLM